MLQCDFNPVIPASGDNFFSPRSLLLPLLPASVVSFSVKIELLFSERKQASGAIYGNYALFSARIRMLGARENGKRVQKNNSLKFLLSHNCQLQTLDSH